MLGIDLLICQAWFTVGKGAMTIKINSDERI